MRLTKHGHACIAIEHDGVHVVIDPGMFTVPEAVEGATAILLTHEHSDHVDVANLRRCDAPIYTIKAVATQLQQSAPDVAERVTVVHPGDGLDIGFPTEVIGANHAVIHPEFERFDNSGFLMRVDDEVIFHPGDALTVPVTTVDVLCVPVSAPWLKVSEAVDYARAVGAPINIGIHDRIYTEAAHGIMRGHLERVLGPRNQSFELMPDGASRSW